MQTQPKSGTRHSQTPMYRPFIKVALKGEFSSILASSVGRGSDNESQGCGLESHCGQDFFKMSKITNAI